ncbi:MAG: 16S rRNA (uracil(1498)-N(3))-methyltransferase [Elusimicrobium sp.]|jgi:16S rRNA (uracil1498-N3)-methyltransferase|nr:16S rRNA (uracil(1498)-N(3))-methyltransferase [Elusimicrobium sp.]
MPQYQAEIAGGKFIIKGGEARHLTGVMRAKNGDGIKIFDGVKKYSAVIESAGKTLVQGSITGEIPLKLPPKNLTLCFSPVGRTETEEILDKGAQLGVRAFLPVITKRTEHDVSKKWDSKNDRWRAVILAAVKQCETSLIPQILPPQKFENALAAGDIIAYEKETNTPLSKIISGKKDIRIFIGPVGGFTEREIELALGRGAQTAALGVNIMRAETAALAAAAIALSL